MRMGDTGRVSVPAGVEWTRAHDAVAAEVERVTALLRTDPDPAAPALGVWNLGEVAAHLAWAWQVLPPLATGADGAPSLVDDVWDLGRLTVAAVEAEPERDPRLLADIIERRAGALLADLRDEPARRSRRWILDGSTVDAVTLVCHLLNETVVHAYDIARAARLPWPISRPHAALVLDGFLFPMLTVVGPALVDQQAARGLRATYAIHVRGGGRHVLAYDDGALVADGPGPHRIDCHLSADPAAMLLVVWQRRSQWEAIARGQLLAWGRRPWLGPRLRAIMRNP